MPTMEEDNDSFVLKSIKKKKKKFTHEIQERKDFSNTDEGNDCRRDTQKIRGQKKKKLKNHLQNDVLDSNNPNLENSENSHTVNSDIIIDIKPHQNSKNKKLKKYSLNGTDSGSGELETMDIQNSFTEATADTTTENSDGKHLENKPILKKKHKHKNKYGQKKHVIKFKTKNVSNNELPSTKEKACKKDKAIIYLEKWKNDKDNWKFEKLTQLWLLKNMFDSSKVPEKTFEMLLEYLIDLKGASKNFAIQLCENILKSMEKKSLTDEKEELLEYSYLRARSVLQYLQ